MKETFKQRMVRLRHRAGLKSQQDAADAIGCKRGTVGMWEAPSSEVDSVGGDYLLRVAAAYKVRPEYINSGKGDDGYPWSPGLPETAPEQRSQPVRLNPVIVRVVARALQETFEDELGREYSIVEYPELFAGLYERTVARGETSGNLVWLGMQIKALVGQGGSTDERGSVAVDGEGYGAGDAGHHRQKTGA